MDKEDKLANERHSFAHLYSFAPNYAKRKLDKVMKKETVMSEAFSVLEWLYQDFVNDSKDWRKIHISISN